MTDDDLITGLLRQLRDADPDVRCEAAGALGALGRDGAGAVGPLLDACRDTNEHVRGEATHSLWELAGSCVGVIPDAEQRLVSGVATLVALLNDPSNDVQDSAIGVLERLGTAAAAALPQLRELAANGHPDRMAAAVKAIEAIAGT